MQDKEILDEAEEVLTYKTETSSTCSDSKDSTEEKKDNTDVQAKKEQQKDRSVFKKKKQTKKDRTDKNSPSRFFGDGVSFKGKLIGVETVNDARGDKMCQEVMTKLKVNVRSTGSHKRKITISLSIKGVKIRDEKTGELLYHHPVPTISFISQEISDARAFGYVFGSSEDSYQFFAIKTEKPAFHVVIALRDLFQTVLDLKKEIRDDEQRKASVAKSEATEVEVEEIKDDTKAEIEENKGPIYFDVVLAPEIGGPFIAMEETTADKDPIKSVDDLLGSPDELEKLQQGIDQMDTSIAEVAFNFEKTPSEKDPFDTSFVLGPKDAFRALQTPVPLTSSSPATVEVLQLQHPTSNGTPSTTHEQSSGGDKYAAFSTLDASPGVFGNSGTSTSPFNSSEPGDTSAQHIPDIQELEEQIMKKSNDAPPKPPRRNRTPPPDLSVFADLDPLGKDRPYKDKTEFFQDVKNPPKKVLNDLVDKTSANNVDESMSKVFDTHFGSPPSVFPAGFETLSHVSPTSVPSRFPPVSTSLPSAFPNHPKLSVPFLVNGNAGNPRNPFENTDHTDLPKTFMSTDATNISYLGKTPPSGTFTAATKQFSISHSSENTDSVQSQSAVCSSPIPIPSRPQPMMQKKDRSLSTGSISSSLYSRSPVSFISESPTHVDYFGQNISDIDGSNLVGMSLKCDTVFQRNLSVDDGASCNAVAGSGVYRLDKSMVSPSGKTSRNGLSRPRPRPSSSKIMSVNNNGAQQSFQPFNVPSTENEVISKENMQSIANVLLINGHRFRKNSLPTPSHSNCDVPAEKTIFTKKGDPFADDFFCSLPKKVNGHIAEIQDCT